MKDLKKVFQLDPDNETAVVVRSELRVKKKKKQKQNQKT